MTKSAVCYTCVTNGYDAVEPVSLDWSTHFIMFHDNTVEVPEGWQGVNLSVPGVSGIDLNRYAKMLPHRLGLPASRSLYVDGNIFFRADPAKRIHDALAEHRFAAMAHPAQDCAYSDIERTLKLGFVWPRPARRAVSFLRKNSVPANAGLFECGILYRRHDDPSVVALCEAWWRAWQMGYPRDQALMIAAAYETGIMPASLGVNDLRDPTNPILGLRPHNARRGRAQRLPRRIASEAMFYRQWVRP